MDIEDPVSTQVSRARAEHDSLQVQLADRASTVRFAQAGVSMMAALIMSGAAGKLFWDSKKFPWLGLVAALLALVLVTYSVSRYVAGRRHLKRELELLASLQVLRRSLGLDDPSVLLPQ